MSEAGVEGLNLRGGRGSEWEEETAHDQESVPTYDDCNPTKSTNIQEPRISPGRDSGVQVERSENNSSPGSLRSVCESVPRNASFRQKLSFTMPEPHDVLPRFHQLRTSSSRAPWR